MQCERRESVKLSSSLLSSHIPRLLCNFFISQTHGWALALSHSFSLCSFSWEFISVHGCSILPIPSQNPHLSAPLVSLCDYSTEPQTQPMTLPKFQAWPLYQSSCVTSDKAVCVWDKYADLWSMQSSQKGIHSLSLSHLAFSNHPPAFNKFCPVLLPTNSTDLPFSLQLHDLCSLWTNCSLFPALQLHDLHSSQQTIPSSFTFSSSLPVSFPIIFFLSSSRLSGWTLQNAMLGHAP